MEGQCELPSPHQGSLRKAVAAALALDGESTIGRRKKKKKESRPESIIVYRSENEKSDEEPGELEGGDQPKAEEGDDFLDYPTDDGMWNMPLDSRYVTLTGTITRGKKKGQMVDIHVTLSEKELQELTKPKASSRETAPGGRKACQLGADRGPHVVLWTLVCLPVVFILSFVVSFYYGTITWYNIFLVYNEERTFWHKISCCPCLILFYPVLIMAMASSLGLYAAVVQLSWSWGAWWQAARDMEKGFCGWLCSKLGLEDCSPYSIVELLESDNISGNLSNKDTTLEAAVVLCVDVGFAMSNSFPGEESPFELAKKVITMFVQRQVFAESKDEIALVLFGTDGTENALAGKDQYQNITVHRHLKLPDFDLLEDIESKIQPGSQQADFLDALIVCMDLIQQETIGKKFEKRHIEVFTDLSSPFSKDQLDIIIHNLKKSGISLQFFLPFPVGKEDGTGDRGDSSLRPDHHGPSFPLKGITEQQKEGIQMVKKVMMSLEGEDGLDEIYSFSESLRQLCIFKKIEKHSMPWPCQLTIGSNLSIRIVAYKSILQEKVKQSWTAVDARTLKKEDIRKETVYCLNDDDETEVPKEDTIQGFRYGSDIIPFSKVDEEQMKYKSEGKCFSVLGFCRSSQVHRKYFMGNQVLKVFAAKDDEAAAVALSSLIHALDELDMVAVVRYAYDKKANPQVGVAFPYIKDAYECLVYIQLPFMEDLRQYMFSSLKNNKKCTPTEAQLSAVDSLIDSMCLVKKDEEEGTIEDLFPTVKIPNPQFQRLFQCLLHRALHPQEPLPPIQQHILNMLDPPTEVTAKCQIPLSKIKTLFPLTEVIKKKDQVTAQDIFQDNHEEAPSSKKLKTEEEEAHFRISSLAEGSVTRVGSVTPAENFRVLVRQKKASFEEASHQLISHIEQFLDTNETPYFMKSMDCIKVFREEAIQFSEEQRFNSFLRALREKVEMKQLNHFWEIVIQDGMTLITKDEASGSSVTVEEAQKFLEPEENPNEDTAAMLEEGGDVDDLLDLI